ncbi:MAG: hypothetical protein IKE55_02525 [Kiritimatiellae bacterium]|nr:hypothetical protein [Kiritimatiellia bacterium]
MNTKKRMSAMLLFVLVAATATAADIPVAWTAGATPSTAGDGALAFTYSGGEVATVVADPGAGNRVVVTGDAMAFASGAAITAASGEVVFENAATGHGALSVAPQTDDAELTWGDGSVALDKAPNWTLLFPGKNLDEYEPATAKGPTGSSNPPNTTALQFHRFARSGSGASATLAFHAVSKHSDATNGKYIKVVKGTLRQSAAGIEGAVESAYLVSRLPYYNDWDDVDYMMAHPADYPYAKTSSLSIPGSKSGYGIGILTMVRVSGKPSVRFENVLSDADAPGGTLALNVASGVSVVAAGANGVAATPYGGAVTSASGSDFGFTDRAVTTTRAFSLGGTFNVRRETALGEETCREYLDGYLVSNVWRHIPGARALEDLTNAVGVAAGGNVGAKNRGKPMRLYNVKMGSGGFTATGQFQVGGNGQDKYTRFIRAEFSTTQATHQVSMRAVSAGYYETSTVYVVGYDLDALPSGRIKGAAVGSEWSTGSGYAILNVTNYFSRPPVDIVELSTSANSFANGAKVVVGGTENGNARLVLSKTTTSLPTNGVLEIRAGGSAVYGQIGAAANTDYVNGTCPINVHQGGELIDRVETICIGSRQEINLLGGMLRCGRRMAYDANRLGDAGTYVNLLTLSDGAMVTSPVPIRIGYQRSDPRWMVRGSSPSFGDASLILMSQSETGTDTMPFTFDVWDVTDDDAADFTLSGALGNKYSNKYLHGYVVKTGSGTMLLKGGAPTYKINYPIEIQGGTWALGSPGAAQSSSAAAGFKLAGGDLAVSAGVACTTGVGPLAVAAAGTLKVESGASIAFADSSATEWTLPVGAHLLIDADLGDSSTAVRFGTDAGGLSEAQLRRIRTPDGAHVSIDAGGYLHENFTGFRIEVR